MNDVIELFSHLASRRWQYPCSQKRIVTFQFYIPVKDSFVYPQCIVEDLDVGVQNQYCTSQVGQWDWFRLETFSYINPIIMKISAHL